MSRPETDETGGARNPSDLDRALAEERDALKALFPLPPAQSDRATVKPGKSARGTRAAKATALAAIVSVSVLWLDPAYRSEHHASAVGEHRAIELADGSRLTLDTATSVHVSWHLRSRRSSVHHGRVAFAVAPSGLRPFEVRAGKLNVEVVGTVFDVRHDLTATSVTVSEGKVRAATPGDGAVMLVRGQRLSVDATHDGASLDTVDVPSAVAWQEGRLVFDRTPLIEALSELQRYRDTPMRLHDPRLGRLEVSGVFDTGNTAQLLELLPKIIPVSVSRAADGGIDITAR